MKFLGEDEKSLGKTDHQIRGVIAPNQSSDGASAARICDSGAGLLRISQLFCTRITREFESESPHWTDGARVALEVVGLIAGVEILEPRVAAGVLRRTPIVARRKTTNTRLSQVGIHQHHLAN